jgi:hypothetical protein
MSSLNAFLESFLTRCAGNKGNRWNIAPIPGDNAALHPLRYVPASAGEYGTGGTGEALDPPFPRGKVGVEQGKISYLAAVPPVPPVPPTECRALAVIVARQIADAVPPMVRLGGPMLPPTLDDLTARCINRLGGWIEICDRWRSGVPDIDLAEIELLLREFIPRKESGAYMADTLPILQGTTGSTRAFRLPWPSDCPLLMKERCGQV